MKKSTQEGSLNYSIYHISLILLGIFGLLGIARAECIGAVGTDDIVISDKPVDFYISGDVVDCDTTGSITLGPNVTIPTESSFNLTAPHVYINENVTVLSGGVLAVDASICVVSAEVDCRGLLPDWPAGTLRDEVLGEGKTHVWEVVYDKKTNKDGSFMLFDGGLKTISISLKPNDFSLDMPCQLTQISLQQPLSYAPVDTAAWYQCGLEDGKKYFVNIKSNIGSWDRYSMAVY